MLTPIATVEERLRIIHECRQSGLAANEWCRQHGLRWNTYHTWVTRLKKKGLLESAATVPTVMIHEPDLPDIVKVDLTGGRELRPVEYESNSTHIDLYVRHSQQYERRLLAADRFQGSNA